MEEVRTTLSVLAIFISCVSLWFTRKLWLESNRPIVTAEVRLYTSGVGAAAFNLYIYNSGTRPATNITLHAKKKDLDKIISTNAKPEDREQIYEILSGKSKIAVLLNGKNTSTAFFSFSKYDPTIDKLVYGSEIPIEIIYSSLEGRNYKSNLCLVMRDSKGFGGSVWETKTRDVKGKTEN